MNSAVLALLHGTSAPEASAPIADRRMSGCSHLFCVLQSAIALALAAAVLVFGVRRAHAYVRNESAPSAPVTALVIMAGIFSCLRSWMTTTYWIQAAGVADPVPMTPINTDTHLGIFFATALASGLTNALALVVAMTYGVMEPSLKKLAWVTLFASVAGIPAASSWIVYRSVPGVAYALLSRCVCNYIII